MSPSLPSSLRRVHYAWIVLAVTFLIMLVTAGIRATPSVMIVPLEHSLGWTRTAISFALAINLALYGLMGPFAAAAMQRFGMRRIVLLALAALATGIASSSRMTTTWQLVLWWGVVVGGATGVTSMTLGAAMVNRWFAQRRGLAMGILTASSASGQLVFLPLMAWLMERQSWRPVVWLCALATAIVLPIVALLMPEKPAAIGVKRYGESSDAPAIAETAASNPLTIAVSALGAAVKHRDFWLLFASFFICGLSTNGYIGTHFIAMCGDYGLTPVRGASMLAMMGIFDLFGTTLSGWLSDRFPNRMLLFWYYGLRGLALIYLPYAFGLEYFGLPIFGLFYGLDWVATVPPTVRLTTDIFGTRDAPVIFGWIVAGHQLGAAVAAFGGGVLRHALGSYTLATTIVGTLCVAGAVLVLRINRHGYAASAANA